jgi:hypothetical protein
MRRLLWIVGLVFGLSWTPTTQAQLVAPPSVDWVSIPGNASVGDTIWTGIWAHANYSDNSDGNDWNAGAMPLVLAVNMSVQRPGESGWTQFHGWIDPWAASAEAWGSFTINSPGTHYVKVQVMDGRPWYSEEYLYGIAVANPAPTITSALSVSVVKSAGSHYQITTSGPATSYGATGLPAGMTINTSTGVIGNVPTATIGHYPVTITAHNAIGSDSKTLNIYVCEISPITITTNTGQVVNVITNPNPAITFGQSVTLNATITDPSGTMDGQGVNGNLGIADHWAEYASWQWFSATSSRAFSITYQPTNVGIGQHWMSVQAHDAYGYPNIGFNLTVNRATPAITWNPDTSTLPMGSTLAGRLNATAVNPHSSSSAFAPPSPTYTVTSGPALVGQAIDESTVLATPGTYTVQVSWPQTANFNQATVTKTFPIDAGIVTNGSVTPGVVFSDQQPVQLYFNGSAAAGLAWIEGTVWKGQTALQQWWLPANSSVSFTPTAGNGVYWFQMRVVDIHSNYSDQWISFFVGPQTSTLPYATSFEQSQGYVVDGNLYPQQGWWVWLGASDIVNNLGQHGSASVRLNPASQIAKVQKYFTSSATQAFIDVYARPVATTTVNNSSWIDNGASRLGFVKVSPTQGAIHAYHGDGNGGGSWQDTGARFATNASGQANQWMRLTVDHNYTTHQWQLIVDGVRVASDRGMPSSSATALTDIIWWGTTSAAAYLDNFTATTVNPFPAPGVPINLNDTAKTDETVSLSWTLPGGSVPAVLYEITRTGGTTGTVKTTSTTPSATVGDLYPSTAYTFTVRARNAAGYWSISSAGESVTTLADQTPPQKPDALTPSAFTPVSFVLSWNVPYDRVGVTGYEVQLDGVTVASPTSPSHPFTGLLPSTVYTLRVRARDAIPNWSDWSDPLTVTTPAPDMNADYDGDGVTTGVELFLGLNPYYDPNDVNVYRYSYDKINQLKRGPGGEYKKDAEGNIEEVQP